MRPRNFWVPKRVSTPKGAQISPVWNISVFQVEIPSNNEYRPNLKPNGWKLLNLWPTALSGTQNCPIPIGPFRGKFWYFGPNHLLDIITKEKLAKFQIKWTTAWKVMRPRNFWVPKRVSTKKGPKSGPYEIFPVLQVEIPQNYGDKPNLKRNRFKYLNLGPTEQSVPKLPQFPNPYFGTEIGNSDGACPEISYI